MTWSPEELGEFDEDGGVTALLLPPADPGVGPARPLSADDSADICLTAVGAALAAREADRRAPSRAAPPAPRARSARSVPPARRWTRPLAVAAALLLVASLGTGASAVALRLLDIELGSAELPPSPPAAEPPPPTHRPPAPVPPAPAPAGEVAPAAAAPEATRAALDAPARRIRPAPGPRRRAVAAARPDLDAPVVVPEDRPPEDLLALANERLRRREWRGADAFYRAVADRFPGTDAAAVAEVASAALHLENLGDAAGALASYRRALGARPSGPLAEDARWGIAEVHRALGDGRAEAAALREFLLRHPDSTLAPAARRRLERIAP